MARIANPREQVRNISDYLKDQHINNRNTRHCSVSRNDENADNVISDLETTKAVIPSV